MAGVKWMGPIGRFPRTASPLALQACGRAGCRPWSILLIPGENPQDGFGNAWVTTLFATRRGKVGAGIGFRRPFVSRWHGHGPYKTRSESGRALPLTQNLSTCKENLQVEPPDAPALPSHEGRCFALEEAVRASGRSIRGLLAWRDGSGCGRVRSSAWPLPLALAC